MWSDSCVLLRLGIQIYHFPSTLACSDRGMQFLRLVSNFYVSIEMVAWRVITICRNTVSWRNFRFLANILMESSNPPKYISYYNIYSVLSQKCAKLLIHTEWSKISNNLEECQTRRFWNFRKYCRKFRILEIQKHRNFRKLLWKIMKIFL